MTRLATAIVILIGSLLFAAFPARAQSDQSAPQDARCFPWQEFRDGACVASSKALPARCMGGSIDAGGACVCPGGTHLDAESSTCVAGASPSRQLTTTIREGVQPIVCDGGTVTSGKCTCPAESRLLAATSGTGDSCVRSNAENCRGGDLTAAGTCLCNGRVTMSGETYALELLGGKCVPKRCPVDTYLREGQCVASNDRVFGFTCRTGYIPDETNPGTPATGLHCAPDPTFCPAEQKRKNGACAKSAAIAIDCFEGRCTCGPNADWTNYLCQCAEPYRNVNGSCVASGVVTASRPAEKPEAEKPELQSAEPSHPRKACGRGLIRTRAGNCVVARRGYPAGGFEGGGNIGAYYPGGQVYRYRGDPVPQQGPYN